MELAGKSRRAPTSEPEGAPIVVIPKARKASSDLLMVEVKANVATSKILSTIRELQPIDLAKQRVRMPGSSYSAVCCFHGALLCTLGAVQASFKPVAGADADKVFRTIFFEFSGVPSQTCVFKMRSLQHHRLVQIGTRQKWELQRSCKYIRLQ